MPLWALLMLHDQIAKILPEWYHFPWQATQFVVNKCNGKYSLKLTQYTIFWYVLIFWFCISFWCFSWCVYLLCVMFCLKSMKCFHPTCGMSSLVMFSLLAYCYLPSIAYTVLFTNPEFILCARIETSDGVSLAPYVTLYNMLSLLWKVWYNSMNFAINIHGINNTQSTLL